MRFRITNILFWIIVIGSFLSLLACSKQENAIVTLEPTLELDARLPVDENGEVNTVIAPIYRMKSDTLIVTAQINEWEVTQSIKIVLE